MATFCSRLAPSPTGALHLGNARTFLWNWALARTSGWGLTMRIEDLDGPRIESGSGEAALDILRWIGLDWDSPVLTQSQNMAPYLQAINQLAAAGLAYPCRMSRKDIAASAPQEGEHETRFAANLRPDDAGQPRSFQWNEGSHWRLLVDPEVIEVHDQLQGERSFNPSEECGDFVIWTVRNEPAYQLAVVVDDLRQKITDVVRGDDLLPSAARQQLIYRHLGKESPRWWHLPLVRGADGRRLAKRHGDTRISHYRETGTSPERMLGLLASWCGLIDEPQLMKPEDLLEKFDPGMLPRQDVIFSKEDEQWLTG